jgi:hypothetical protein
MVKLFMWLGTVLVALGTVLLLCLGVSLLLGGELPGIILLFLGGVAGACLIEMVGDLIHG